MAEENHIEVTLTIFTTAAIANKLSDNDITRAINRGLDTLALMASDVEVMWGIEEEEDEEPATGEETGGTVVDLGARMRARAKELNDGR